MLVSSVEQKHLLFTCPYILKIFFEIIFYLAIKRSTAIKTSFNNLKNLFNVNFFIDF